MSTTTLTLSPPLTPRDVQLCSQWALLPKTIYYEARGEPFEGKVAVGEVLMARTRAKYRGKQNVAAVALDKFQFSPYLGPVDEIDPEDDVFLECCNAAALAISGTTNYAKGALHFLNPDIARPSWYDPAKVVASIGNHEFLAGVD